MSKPISKIWRRGERLSGDQRGITGLETAIVLIAFVVVSSVFAFAALSTGLFSSDQAKQTINAGLAQAQGSLEIRGSVIAEDTDEDGNVDVLTFQVANAAGGNAVDLTPGKTIIRYADEDQTLVLDEAGEFTITPMGNADADNLVEGGEIIEISISGLETALTTNLGTSTTFSIQVLPPQGATLHIERTTPPVLAKYNDLN